jgi:hypothetical protein
MGKNRMVRIQGHVNGQFFTMTSGGYPRPFGPKQGAWRGHRERQSVAAHYQAGTDRRE